nr:uncharacterized protein LOC112805796 [Arachis hypogaea]
MAATATVSELKNMCKKHKPAIVYLMETRYIKSNNNPNWKCCFTYGNPIFKQRRRTWQAISESKDLMDEPSCFIGDFNDILHQEEKIGKHPKPRIQIEEFRNLVHKKNLMDLELKGNHCPLLLNIEPNQRVPRQFRYEAYWDDKEECKEVIRKGWTSKAQGGDWNNFMEKTSNCIKNLQEWNRKSFKRADEEITRLQRKIQNLQNSHHNPRQQHQIENAKQRIRELWRQEEKYWAQRARVKWLKWGDRNTAFFHASTIQRRDRNRIDRLRDAEGRWVQEQEEILRLIEDYYSKLFTSSGQPNLEECIKEVPKRVTEEMNTDLLKEVTEDEIKQAAFSMDGSRAPGPDGLNGLFYQNHWSTISNDVCAVVKNFFQGGSIPKQINETQVVLIPKIKQAETLNQLRPISCCNYIYKIISKVLVARLRGIIDKIVSPTQSAFISGRLIQDNIVIVQEAIHRITSKGKEATKDLAIKLDMNKAYDRMEWKFIEEALKAFGFHQEWVKLIMECIRSVTYKFKINGALTKEIIPQRGLRQGDPLSPYLFILASEIFTILMDNALNKKIISGVKLAPKAPIITHLLFADDCIIFSGAEEEEIYQLVQILNQYTSASGQVINLEKSGIIFGNQIPIQTRVNIEDILNIPTWDSPGRYLGLPAQWGRAKGKALEWIMEKVEGKIEGWKESLLNQAGKEVLIKAVIQAIPTYAMSILRFPKSFCNKLNAKIAKFWWRSQGRERGIHWKAWPKLCKSKKEGGLGFKEFHHQNTAHLAKQAWRVIRNPEAKWVQVLKALYFPDCDFWEASKHRKGTWIWNSLLQGRELIKSKGKWSIGKGSGVKVWGDNWIHGFNEPLKRGGSDNQRVEELLTPSRVWDRAKIQRSFPPVVAQKILQTPVSRISKEDRLLWPFRKDGEFTTKTGYYAAKKEEDERSHYYSPSSSSVFEELWEGIWNIKAPQKIKMFLWKVAHNIIPVRANLKKKSLLTNSVCPICAQEEETSEHTLLLCDWTRAVWFGSQSQCTPTNQNVRSVGQWLQQMYIKCKEANRTEVDQNWSRIGITMWTIWKARNNYEYNNIEPNPESTINHARIIEKEYNSLIKENISKVREDNKGRSLPVIWRPPPQSWLKVNSDAAFSIGTKTGATASVIRDHTGKILGGSATVIQANSSLSAEAQALREAVILVENLNIQRAIIETDSLQIVQTLKSGDTIWEIDPIIQDIISIQKRLSNCGFTWTPREGNRLAHSLAALKLKNLLPASWPITPPPQTADIIRRERIGLLLQNSHQQT